MHDIHDVRFQKCLELSKTYLLFFIMNVLIPHKQVSSTAMFHLTEISSCRRIQSQSLKHRLFPLVYHHELQPTIEHITPQPTSHHISNLPLCSSKNVTPPQLYLPGALHNPTPPHTPFTLQPNSLNLPPTLQLPPYPRPNHKH
jgi:hypothetical protein